MTFGQGSSRWFARAINQVQHAATVGASSDSRCQPISSDLARPTTCSFYDSQRLQSVSGSWDGRLGDRGRGGVGPLRASTGRPERGVDIEKDAVSAFQLGQARFLGL